MTAPIQLLYASHDGHTKHIAKRLWAEWRYENQPVQTYNLARDKPDPLLWPEGSVVVILSPIRFGYHLPCVETFLRLNKEFLEDQKLVMISVNLTARKDNKNTPRTNPYFRKWVKRHALHPTLGAVFGGNLNYSRYKLWEKWAIKLIMAITGGPTDFNAAIDYTNWDQVDALARRIITLAENQTEATWSKTA